MGDLAVFPIDRRVSLVRTFSYDYLRARTRRARKDLLDSVIRREVVAPLRLLGFSREEAGRQADAFCAAVQSEIGHLEALLVRPAS